MSLEFGQRRPQPHLEKELRRLRLRDRLTIRGKKLPTTTNYGCGCFAWKARRSSRTLRSAARSARRCRALVTTRMARVVSSPTGIATFTISPVVSGGISVRTPRRVERTPVGGAAPRVMSGAVERCNPDRIASSETDVAGRCAAAGPTSTTAAIKEQPRVVRISPIRLSRSPNGRAFARFQRTASANGRSGSFISPILTAIDIS